METSGRDEMKSQVAGVLLAGGQSRRMGGGDKGLLRIGQQPMIAHVIDRLRPQAEPLVINANGNQSRFQPFGLPVVSDPVEGHVGPLAGVLAGMTWSAAHAPHCSHIVTVSTDAPFVPLDLVARLTEALENGDGTIALAASGDRVHPVIGLWPVSLAGDLEAALRDGVRKVLHWTDRHGTVRVNFAMAQCGGQSIDPFFNANTPEELEQARALIES